jgi:hypothetical protein
MEDTQDAYTDTTTEEMDIVQAAATAFSRDLHLGDEEDEEDEEAAYDAYGEVQDLAKRWRAALPASCDPGRRLVKTYVAMYPSYAEEWGYDDFNAYESFRYALKGIIFAFLQDRSDLYTALDEAMCAVADHVSLHQEVGRLLLQQEWRGR